MKSIVQTTSKKAHFKEIRPGIMQGAIRVPPSKSVSHRLLIIAALSGNKCKISNVLRSEDIQITLDSLKKMGFQFDQTRNNIYMLGRHQNLTPPVEIFLGNSGTSARLLTAVASILPGEFILDGTKRMRERPMMPLIDALIQLQVTLDHHSGFLPIHIKGDRLAGGKVIVDVTKSSQFLSALLLISPFSRKGVEIFPVGKMASTSYVDLTVALMKSYGILFEERDKSIYIAGEQNYQSKDAVVEGDFSSASYFGVGPAISGGKIIMKNLNKDSKQGDKIILDILKKAGCGVVWKSKGLEITSSTKIQGIEVDMNNFPDLVPSVAVLALFAQGISRMKNVSHLRYKESDRLNVIQENIKRLGGKAIIENDDLIVVPQPLKGAFLPTYNDHRMAMSFALVGLRIPGVKIGNPDCVNKSFPNFWKEFDQLVQPAVNQKY